MLSWQSDHGYHRFSFQTRSCQMQYTLEKVDIIVMVMESMAHHKTLKLILAAFAAPSVIYLKEKG